MKKKRIWKIFAEEEYLDSLAPWPRSEMSQVISLDVEADARMPVKPKVNSPALFYECMRQQITLFFKLRYQQCQLEISERPGSSSSCSESEMFLTMLFSKISSTILANQTVFSSYPSDYKIINK